MLIEQAIEFALRGPGPSGRKCTSTAGYFYDKTKIFKANLGMDCYLLLKYCRRRQCTLLPPISAKSHTKFNLKRYDFKRVLDLNCK